MPLVMSQAYKPGAAPTAPPPDEVHIIVEANTAASSGEASNVISAIRSLVNTLDNPSSGKMCVRVKMGLVYAAVSGFTEVFRFQDIIRGTGTEWECLQGDTLSSLLTKIGTPTSPTPGSFSDLLQYYTTNARPTPDLNHSGSLDQSDVITQFSNLARSSYAAGANDPNTTGWLLFYLFRDADPDLRGSVSPATLVHDIYVNNLSAAKPQNMVIAQMSTLGDATGYFNDLMTVAHTGSPTTVPTGWASLATTGYVDISGMSYTAQNNLFNSLGCP